MRRSLSRFPILCVASLLVPWMVGFSQAAEHAHNARIRVCVLTDISGDPDDQQSLVRFLTYRDYSLYSDARDTWTFHDKTYTDNRYAPIFRWRETSQHDFQARMDWCVKPYNQANHPPVVVFNGRPIQDVRPNAIVQLNATGSSDPDGDELSYRWWVYREAGSHDGDVAIRDATKANAILSVPNARPNTQIHVILSVADDGQPSLDRYQRVILTVVAP